MVGRTESPPPPPPKPTRLSKTELENVGRDTLLLRYAECEEYIRFLEATAATSAAAEERQRIKNQLLEVTRRENQLVMKLTIKEQQLQELQSEVESLRARQIPQNSAQLRATLLDPAVNMLFEKMRQELDQTKAKLDETQNELSAWKFTPDSNTGKRLMAKCRLLYQENEELGRMVASGRLAKLEGDLALHRSFAHEMKSSQQEQDEFLLELDEEVEGMQSTIYFLQQELREAKETIARLQGSSTGQLKGKKSPVRSQTEDVDSPSSPKMEPEEDERGRPSRNNGAQTPPEALCSDDNSLLPESVAGDVDEPARGPHGRTDQTTAPGVLRSATAENLSNINNNHNGDSRNSAAERHDKAPPRSPDPRDSPSHRTGDREQTETASVHRAASLGARSPRNGDASSPAGVNGRQGGDHNDVAEQDDIDEKALDGDIASPPHTRTTRRGLKRSAECAGAEVDEDCEDSLDGLTDGQRGATRASSRKGGAPKRRMPAPPRHPDGDSSSEQLIICTNGGIDGDDDEEGSQRHNDL